MIIGVFFKRLRTWLDASPKTRDNLDEKRTVSRSTPSKGAYVFISYSSKKLNEAHMIRDYVEKLGYSCWMAPDSLHKGGTQDYTTDIVAAIKGCRCLIFALSTAALDSDWARREAIIAINCHKAVIPFFVERISPARRSDDFFTLLAAEKQLLNEDGVETGEWDLDVLVPYLRSAFPEIGNVTTTEVNVAGHANNLNEEEVGKGATLLKQKSENEAATREEWERWRSLATFHLARVAKLESIDPLNSETANLSPEACNAELSLSATEAAMSLMRILSTASPIVENDDDFNAEAIRCQASRDLSRLVYEKGDTFLPRVFDFASPYAEAEIPWATFVIHALHYSPDGRHELKEDSHLKARKCLEVAIRDQDNPYARIRLGICWEFGIGSDEVSASRSLYWYDVAARMGCPKAWSWQAALYLWGQYGVRADLLKAEELAQKGAEAGDAKSHRVLGLLSEFRQWAKVNEEDRDFSTAEKEYEKAYQGGCRSALKDLLDLWDNTKMTPTNPNFKDIDSVMQQASRADFPGSAVAFVEKAIKNDEENAANNDDSCEYKVSIAYALSGIRRGDPDCGCTLAEILVRKTYGEEAGEIDITPFRIFATHSPTLQRHASELKEYLDNLILPSPKSDSLSQFGASFTPLPKSSFWTTLFKTGAAPSEIGNISKKSPFLLLKFLRELELTPEDDFYGIRCLWEVMRFLDIAQSAYSIRKENLTDVFPDDSLSVKGSTQEKFLKSLDALEKILPEAVRDTLAQRISNVKNHLVKSGDLSGASSDVDAIKYLLGEKARQKNNEQVLIAWTLANLERRLSSPMLAASLRLLRNGYLLRGKRGYGAEFAILFNVLNARYVDSEKNAVALFSVRNTLLKVVKQGEKEGVLPLLELYLFGASSETASIKPDFEAIEQLEPVVWELVEAERANELLNGVSDLSIQIAFAMACLFLDRKLENPKGAEGWGKANIYNVSKGLEWLSTVLELCDPNKMFNCREILIHSYDMAFQLKKEGYVITKSKLSKFLNAKQGKITEKKKSDMVNALAKCVPPDLDAMAFKSVKLEGEILDLVVSSDDVAVVFAVYPEDEDYAVLPREDENEDTELVSDGILSTKLDLLVKQREILQKMESDADIRLAIIASTNTLESMRNVWGVELDEKQIELVEYRDFEVFLRKFFSLVSQADDDENA